MNEAIEQARQQLKNSKRIVVKVGTHILLNKNGQPNRRRITNLVNELAALHHQGYNVILVTSGAIGAGLSPLGFKRRPTTLINCQMAAAVGQTRLLDIYYHLFKKKHCEVSQILLTHADLKHRGRHLNARNTILNLLRHNIIPIVNENDVVATDEIRFGDNDVLSALVSTLIDADLLILLTTPDGLRKRIKGNRTQRVPYLETINEATLALAFGSNNSLSIGGMHSKLQAASTAIKNGTRVVIACGKKTGIIKQVLNGNDEGTLINPKDKYLNLSKRKSWISYFHRPVGTIIVDSGAKKALQQGKSLLPSGIKKVDGQFIEGSLVNVLTESGETIGHGLSAYSYHEIELIMGKHSKEINTIIQGKHHPEVIHRDNLVIFSRDDK